jgi:hypothetical protein
VLPVGRSEAMNVEPVSLECVNLHSAD